VRDGHRRYVHPGDVAVWCASGRWGPRRIRVTECWVTVTAEAAYTALLRDGVSKARAGFVGVLAWTFGGRAEWLRWELRPNAVWRFGRLFLRCPKCERRVTRIYLPTAATVAACRRCWGLTYTSRQRFNYKRSRSLARVTGLGLLSTREWITLVARTRRADEAKARYWERREILAARFHRSSPTTEALPT